MKTLPRNRSALHFILALKPPPCLRFTEKAHLLPSPHPPRLHHASQSAARGTPHAQFLDADSSTAQRLAAPRTAQAIHWSSIPPHLPSARTPRRRAPRRCALSLCGTPAVPRHKGLASRNWQGSDRQQRAIPRQRAWCGRAACPPNRPRPWSVFSFLFSLFFGLASQFSIKFIMDSIAIYESDCLNFSPTLLCPIVDFRSLLAKKNFRSQIRREKGLVLQI